MKVWESSTNKPGLDVDTKIVCRAVQLLLIRHKVSLSAMIMFLFNV